MMKAKELAELLMANPDFEVEAVFATPGERFPDVETFRVVGVADVGHSDRVVALDLERER